MTLDSFDSLLERFGPFEKNPRLAVAVSGGSDSLALILLAQEWARKKEGTVLGLTVDHGLRSHSREEAETVGLWLQKDGISHEILPWEGPKPETRLQERARKARYALLNQACVRHGILHLLMAHTLEDQQETILMRGLKGSGALGLAGISTVTYHAFGRLLRPLLTTRRETLQAYLRLRKQPWVTDPSNENLKFLRVQLRQDRKNNPSLEEIQFLGHHRCRLEETLISHIEERVSLSPFGYVSFSEAWWISLASRDRMLLLSRMLQTVSGADYPPRTLTLSRTLERLKEDASFTAAGCLFLKKKGKILILREPRAALTSASLGDRTPWDGRFRIFAPQRGTLETIGEAGWLRLLKKDLALKKCPVPYAAKISLPVLVDKEEMIALPELFKPYTTQFPVFECFFAPKNPLTPRLFSLV